jgi:hypothetical protein
MDLEQTTKSEQLTKDELKLLSELVGNMTVSLKDAPAGILLLNKLARLIDQA